MVHSNTLQTIFHLPEAAAQDVFVTDIPHAPPLPAEYTRTTLPLPQCAENEVVRHYVRLSQKNHSIDTGFYPLGSCTMKYNPKINEDVARLVPFALSHPLCAQEHMQGNLRLMYELEGYLREITGMPAFTLNGAAGAHAEMIGVMVMRRYFEERKEERTIILIPDSAHGTNPASAALCGFTVQEVKTDKRGNVDLDDLKGKLGAHVAALMITNPNTLGLFDEHILEVSKLVHGCGGLVYCDGANMNAMVGVCRPGDFGVDVLHLNLHKTFSTPHGGGGPGAGPVGVTASLEKYLPVPKVVHEDGTYALSFDSTHSIGRVRSFQGNFGVLVRAYTYIRSLGQQGLMRMGTTATLNGNYIRAHLKGIYHLPFERICQHECVFTDDGMPNGITTMDIAKRLLDFGVHSPTIYFPLLVHGALMIEPTETESRETLDRFISIMKQIRIEAQDHPQRLRDAPVNTPVRRLDAVLAARNPIVVETEDNRKVHKYP